jgi:hypothetical protein
MKAIIFAPPSAPLLNMAVDLNLTCVPCMPSPLLIETRASLNEPALRKRGVEDQAVFVHSRRSKRVLRTTVVVPV